MGSLSLTLLQRASKGIILLGSVGPLVPIELAPKPKQLVPSDFVQRSEVLRDDFPYEFRFHLCVPVHEAVAKPSDGCPRNLGIAVLHRLAACERRLAHSARASASTRSRMA